MKPLVFVAACLAAAGWSLYLIVLHNQAIAHTLAPGALCGADGGCGDVLASEWSTILGIPVNAPAVPMYLALAGMGGLVAAGRVAAEKFVGAVAIAGLVGVAFGGWLLWHMLADVGVVCRYCLIADALHLVATATGLWLHPNGIAGSLGAVPEAMRRAVGAGPELALGVSVLLGAPIVAALFPEPDGDVGLIEVVREGERPSGGTATPTGETQQLIIPAHRAEIGLQPDTPTKGPADARVTVVVFEDFQCPFCRTLAGNLEGLLAERPVRVAFLNFPMNQDCNQAPIVRTLHDDACGAAMAGVCAQKQGRFWEMHDTMFLRSARLAPDDLLDHARRSGLDEPAFRTCMADPATRDRVIADTLVGKDLGVTGTPQLFIDGRRFSGGMPVSMLVAAVDALSSDVAPGAPIDVAITGEILGDVAGPDVVSLRGGALRIDAFEASVVGGVARSMAGVEPARGATWYDAQAACDAAGKRLCTESEWVEACTGVVPVDTNGDGVVSNDDPGGRPQPYGMWQDLSYCASARTPEDGLPLLTGNHPRCRTPEGVFDLEGGVKEWVGLTPDRAALKGGSYFSGDSARCLYHKGDVPPDAGGDPTTGFRCCSGPPPAQAAADHHPGGKVGDVMLPWRLRSLEGQWLTAEELRGSPVIVTFWASWCGPCRVEMPVLDEMYRTYRDQGLVVVGINVDTEPARAAAFLRNTPVSFPVVMDPESRVYEQFDTAGMPTTFWVTKSGKIRLRTVGYDERGRERLESAVRELLAAE